MVSFYTYPKGPIHRIVYKFPSGIESFFVDVDLLKEDIKKARKELIRESLTPEDFTVDAIFIRDIELLYNYLIGNHAMMTHQDHIHLESFVLTELLKVRDERLADK